MASRDPMRKILCMLLCIVICAYMALPITHAHDHDHPHESCTLCQAATRIAAMLLLLFCGWLMLRTFAHHLYDEKAPQLCAIFIGNKTPVSLKTRMND